MSVPHSFSKDGARRVVRTVRTVEANDPLYGGPKRRRVFRGHGPEQFIIGRVFDADEDNPLLLSVIEQFWNEDDEDMADLPGGRIWDGESGNPPKVRVIDGKPRALESLVALGFRAGANDTAVWYVVPERGSESFWGEITASTSDGDNKWLYSGTEKRRTSTGWEDKPGGRTFTGAINGMESPNSASGVQGNGIDLDGAIFTDNDQIEMQPIATGVVVRVWEDLLEDGTKVYTFNSPNAMDGPCGLAPE